MTDVEFQALLDRRHELRVRHEGWCREVNELRLPESSFEAARRDAAFRELEKVQAQIDAELEAERSAELEGP
jgi:hypothetical protein